MHKKILYLFNAAVTLLLCGMLAACSARNGPQHPKELMIMSAENTLRPGALKEGLFDSGLVPAPCASVNDMRSYQPLNFFPSKTESVCWFGRLDTTAQMLQFERNAYAVFWLKPDGALYSRQNIRPEFNKSLRSELVLPRREKDATGKWKVIVKKGREVLDSREFYLLELA